MPGTEQETVPVVPISPFEPSLSMAQENRVLGPTEIVAALLDTAERLIGDRSLTLKTILAEVNRRLDSPNGSVKRAPISQSAAIPPSTKAGTATSPRRDFRGVPRREFTNYDLEKATYARLKPELLAQAEGKYVVLVGDEVIGPFSSSSQAEREGYTAFGLGALYIKRILAVEPKPAEISRFFSS